MVDLGESLNSPILPYSGKQLLSGSSSAFFGFKSEVKSRYIYDLGLSTGEILYSGRGGMGITDEPYVIRLHDLLHKPYAESLIQEEFTKYFKGKWGPRKFYSLRRDVNQDLKNPSRRTIARLYCLLSCSGFRYKFDKHGNFKGEYFPHTLDTSSIKIHNKKLVNSDFILSNTHYKKFDTSILTKNSLVYVNVPFPQTSSNKKKIFEYLNQLHESKVNFLLSGRHSNRGLIDQELLNWSKFYDSFIVSQFKEESSFLSSDIFIFNF